MKKCLIFLMVILLMTTNLAYAKGVYENYDEIADIQKGETTTPLGVIIKSFISDLSKF